MAKRTKKEKEEEKGQEALAAILDTHPEIKGPEEKKAQPKAKKEKEVRECVCGCGNMTHGLFFPSHDGKVHGWFVRARKGDKDVTTMPKHVQLAWARWDGTAAVSRAFAD